MAPEERISEDVLIVPGLVLLTGLFRYWVPINPAIWSDSSI